jgi:prephenate dehydrogenase
MKEDAVLLDTAPAKGPLITWVQESLPSGRHYVGLVPAVNPKYLAAPESGIKGARDDLFGRAVMIVAAPPNTPAEVEQLAVNLCNMLGAKPLLADLAESDGLMAATHLMPQLMAAVLMEVAEAGSGWLEARKVAGRPFAAVTGGAAYFDDAGSLEIAALANQRALVHGLDVLIAALTGMRQEILDGDQKGVAERLQHSFRARERWLDERGAAEWLGQGADAVEIPELGEQMMRAIFGGRIMDRNKPKKKKADRGPHVGGSRR